MIGSIFDASTLIRINIWSVLCFLAGHQFYIQITSRDGDRYPEGAAKTLQYIVGIPTLLLLSFFLLDPDFNPFVLLRFSPALRDVGVGVFGSAALLILSAHLSLGRFWSGELQTAPGHRLIESGLYGLVRHPLYTSYFVLTGGLFLITANWLVAGSMLAYFAAVATRVPREEEMLLRRVEGYGGYVLRVGRFLPKWSRATLLSVRRAPTDHCEDRLGPVRPDEMTNQLATFHQNTSL
jgi:protein-S-isoprenylcysteine O-methyltransferase Ste14